MSQRRRTLATTLLVSAGTLAAALVMLWPRPTHAEEVPDDERRGEWEEDGMRFGNIVVSGKLVADATTRGGWTLVRTLENKADTPENCVIEERILQTETTPESRASPPGMAVLLRNQPIKLGPHQKVSIGIPLPEKLGLQVTAGLKAKAAIEQQHARAIAAEKYDAIDYSRSYSFFTVEYLKPLPAGATAERHSRDPAAYAFASPL